MEDPISKKEKQRACDAARYVANREKVLAASASRQRANPEKYKAYQAAYRPTYYAENRDKIKENGARHYAGNREKVAATHARYYAANKEKLRMARAKHRAANRERLRIVNAKYIKTRRDTDPMYRLFTNLQCLIGGALRRSGFYKKSRTIEILGCTPTFFKAYIEQRFLPGMSWENRDLWHIDHIMPVASAKTEKELIKLNHYTNLRPLWAADNIRKRDSVPEQLTLMAA